MNNAHGGCKPGTCKAQDRWRRVSCAGGDGDVEAAAESVTLPVEADWSWDQCAVCGSVEVKDRRWVVLLMKSPTVARAGWCAADECQKDLSITERTIPAAALAAQPAAPQPTEGGALTEAEVESRMALLSPASIAVAEDVWTEDEPTLAEYELTERILAARSQRPEGECACAPCPGRGNDGHGMAHCAECCFGTGVEADIACPVHGAAAQRPEGVTVTKVPNTGDALHDFTEHLKRQRTEGVTVTEWGVKWVDVSGTGFKVGHIRYRGPDDRPYVTEESARTDSPPGTVVITRQRTTFPDVVTEWAEVPGDTEAGGDRG